MNQMQTRANRIGKSYVRATSRQMIGVGKGLSYLGDKITPVATSGAVLATSLGQPELAAPLAGVAFLGAGMSAGGRGLLGSGRAFRNIGLKGESYAQQKKHIDQLTESAEAGEKLFNLKY